MTNEDKLQRLVDFLKEKYQGKMEESAGQANRIAGDDMQAAYDKATPEELTRLQAGELSETPEEEDRYGKLLFDLKNRGVYDPNDDSTNGLPRYYNGTPEDAEGDPELVRKILERGGIDSASDTELGMLSKKLSPAERAVVDEFNGKRYVGGPPWDDLKQDTLGKVEAPGAELTGYNLDDDLMYQKDRAEDEKNINWAPKKNKKKWDEVVPDYYTDSEKEAYRQNKKSSTPIGWQPHN